MAATRSHYGWAFSVVAVVLPLVARAEGSSVDVCAVAKTGSKERSSAGAVGTSIRAGTARVAVHAPLAAVREIVADFGRYAEYMPLFERSHVLGKTADGTDVYLRLPVLHGAARLWAVLRFAPSEREGRKERIEGKFRGEGNIDDMRATWRLEAIDEHRTLLSLELLLVPKLPVPAWSVTEELEGAAEKAVTHVRDRVQATPNAAGGIRHAATGSWFVGR